MQLNILYFVLLHITHTYCVIFKVSLLYLSNLVSYFDMFSNYSVTHQLHDFMLLQGFSKACVGSEHTYEYLQHYLIILNNTCVTQGAIKVHILHATLKSQYALCKSKIGYAQVSLPRSLRVQIFEKMGFNWRFVQHLV